MAKLSSCPEKNEHGLALELESVFPSEGLPTDAYTLTIHSFEDTVVRVQFSVRKMLIRHTHMHHLAELYMQLDRIINRELSLLGTYGGEYEVPISINVGLNGFIVCLTGHIWKEKPYIASEVFLNAQILGGQSSRPFDVNYSRFWILSSLSQAQEFGRQLQREVLKNEQENEVLEG